MTRAADIAGNRLVALQPSRITRADRARVGLVGLGSRGTRAVVAAIGIAIGIAAMVAVLGIAESSRAGLIAQLDKLGTNLLTVKPGSQLFGGTATLPLTAPAMIRRIGPVQSTSATATVSESVRKTDKIPSVQTGGISVVAAESSLPETLPATLSDGVFLNDATAHYPAVVLRAQTAQYFASTPEDAAVRIDLGGEWFTWVACRHPVALLAER